jgi:hypothetical protein
VPVGGWWTRRHSTDARHPTAEQTHTVTNSTHRRDDRCDDPDGVVSYDRGVSIERPVSSESGERRRRRRIVPGGIIDLKGVLARRGGLAGIGVGAASALFGAFILAVSGSAFLGAVGYVFVAFGIPLLSVVGVPAVSGGARWFLAVIGSAALWFAIGHFSAARVRRKVVAGWREWGIEFALYAGGVCLGVLLGLVFAAKSLGAI